MTKHFRDNRGDEMVCVQLHILIKVLGDHVGTLLLDNDKFGPGNRPGCHLGTLAYYGPI